MREVAEEMAREARDETVGNEKIYRIVNARYQRSAPLVLTTNCSASGDELQTRIGGAAYSRLWEWHAVGILLLTSMDWIGEPGSSAGALMFNVMI